MATDMELNLSLQQSLLILLCMSNESAVIIRNSLPLPLLLSYYRVRNKGVRLLNTIEQKLTILQLKSYLKKKRTL